MAEHDERVKVTADVDLNVNSEKIDKIIDKLEKPITVKLDADGKGIFERVQKDITKIKKSVENIDFSGLAEQISSQMEKGADAGSKALQSAAKNVSSKEAYIQAERDLKTHQNKMLEIVKKAGDLALSHAEGNFLNDANRSNGKLKYTKDIEDTFNSLGKQLRNINTPDIEKFENWAKRVKNTLSPLIGDSYATSFVDYFNKATKDSVQFKNVLEDIDDATKEMNKLAPQIDFAENVQSEAEKAKQSVIDLSNVFEQVISKTSEGKNFTFGEAIEAMRNGIVGIRNTIDSISVKDGAGKVISLQITLDGLDTLKSQLQEADGAANNFQGSLQSINNLEIFSGISSQIKEISSAIESLSKNIKTMSYALDTIGASMDVPIPLKEMQRNQNKSAIDDIKARILEENKLIDDAYSQRTGIVAKNADEMNDVLKQKAPDGKGDTYLALIGKSEKNLSKGKELSDSQIKNLRIATDALEQYLALGGKVQDLEIANLKDGLTDDSFIVKAANEQLKVHQAEIEAATKSKAILEDELSHRQEILAIQDAQLTAAKSSQDAINASLQEELNYRTQITEAMKAQTDAMKAQNDVASSTNALLQEKIEDEKKKARKNSKAISSETFNEISPTAMRNAEDLFASNGWQHVDLNVKQAADGLVTVSAKVKDLEGNWLSYIGTVDEAGEITQKSLGKIDKTAALDKRLDTSEIERRRLTQQEMIDDAERVYRELNLSKDAWDVKVDSNGLVTIKDNLADIAGNAAEVTKQFRDADTAIEGFETAFTKASLHISPQKEVKDSQNSSVKDTVDKTLKQRQKAIEDIKRNLDTGKYNVDLNNLNASFAGYRQAGYVGDNSKLEQQITLIIKAKKELKDLYDISKQRDLTDDEANEFVRLGQVIKAASETAGNEVKLLVTDFGALTTEQERLAGENTIRQWLESNSKAAEEFGTQIKELASEMQTAFTAFDKGNIMAKFNQIKMDAAAMGLTGKLPAETISTDNKKRDESIKRIQKEIEEASILSKYNKITDKLTPYKDARLTSPDVDSQIAKIEQLKDALDKLYDKSKTTDFSNDDAEKMVSTYNDLITAMKKAGVEADNLKSAYGNIIDPAKANKSADSMLKWLENNTRAMKKYGKEIEDLAAKQRNTVKGNEFNANEAAMNSIKSSAYKEGLTGKSWTESFKKGLGSISQLFGSFSLVNRADDIARDMVSTIHDVDDALTDLKMATGVSDSAANDLMKTYSLMGRQLKATGVDIAKSSTEWLKQGQTMEDSMTLTKDAMVLSKIGGLSSEQSTEYLTSGMKGYKVAVEDTLGIVDKLSAVDLVSATDVGGLAEGMSRVAVTAENAGRMCARTYRNIWMLFNNIGNYLNRLNSECL